MIETDICTVFRTTSILNPPYNEIVNNETNIYTYACHVSQQTGIFVQGQPSANITTKSIMYISNVNADIQNGDIVQINNANKYIVQNVYKPLGKIIKCDLMIKSEV
jgi:hypothetical protein